jgi:hypothetical protein
VPVHSFCLKSEYRKLGKIIKEKEIAAREKGMCYQRSSFLRLILITIPAGAIDDSLT